jgi:hypothetical protein
VRTSEFAPPPTNFNLPQPLVEADNPFTPLGCRFQIKFERYSVGAVPGESLLGMSWSPRSDYVFASTYRDVTIKVGHFDVRGYGNNSLNPEFDKNFLQTPGNPLLAYRGDYRLESAVDTPWVPWPDFATDFDYDTHQDLVFEFDMPEGGDTYQLFRNRYIPWFVARRHFANGGATRSRLFVDDTRYWQRFLLVSKRSFGQSMPIQAVYDFPDYTACVLHVDPERPTARASVAWAGSTGLVPKTFYDGIDDADGLSYLSFRVELVADPVTGVPPRVLSLRYAYVRGHEQ